jgi:oligoribonuclease
VLLQDVASLACVLVWMDLEMTGLEPQRHVIVEIATLVTNDELEIVAEGPDLVLGATEEQLNEMGEFVTAMHTRSGLLPQIRSAEVSVADAEQQTLEFLRAAGVEAGTVPLAGNSIGTDRRFLQEYMPELEKYFHYRNVDVSTIKELAQRWYPDVVRRRSEKETTHRALDDIRESISELVFYRSHIFVPFNDPASPQ